MVKLYAVGWQAGNGEVLGKLKNFREIISDERDEYLSKLKFSNGLDSQRETLKEKFEEAIQTLQNVNTNGNNTEVPFTREIDATLVSENARIELITEQLSQDLPKLKDFKQIRLYIIREEIDGVVYRYFLKALRTATLKSSLIATMQGRKVKITDLENEAKTLPFVISYAEKISSSQVTQYIFNVSDYESIFGINESKMKMAKQNYDKFLPSKSNNEPEYKISGIYTVSVEDSESKKIEQKLKEQRKLVNILSKYNNEAQDYLWEHVIKANNLSEMFSQTPFGIDEENQKIILTADSFEAFLSVITNAKKLGIAKNEYEDATADNRNQVH